MPRKPKTPPPTFNQPPKDDEQKLLVKADNTEHDYKISGVDKDLDEKEVARLASLRGFGGPGAAGATVQGPILHAASEAGTKSLPHPEGSTEAAAVA